WLFALRALVLVPLAAWHVATGGRFRPSPTGALTVLYLAWGIYVLGFLVWVSAYRYLEAGQVGGFCNLSIVASVLFAALLPGAVEQIAGEKGLGGGWIRYAGFAGTASLRGSALELVVSGGDVAIVASGRGSARLVGSWSSTDSDLALVAPQAGEAGPEPLRLARREGSRRRR